jgi:hypothetical protein
MVPIHRYSPLGMLMLPCMVSYIEHPVSGKRPIEVQFPYNVFPITSAYQVLKFEPDDKRQ